MLHSDEAKAGFSECFMKDWNISFTVFRAFTQLLVKAPSFSHSSQQTHVSSTRLHGERRCTAIFRPLHRNSTGFRSGLWLCFSRPFSVLPKPLCFLGGVLRVVILLKRRPSPQPEILSALEKVFILFLHPSSPLSRRVSLSLSQKHPDAGLLCWTVEMALTRWCSVLGIVVLTLISEDYR